MVEPIDILRQTRELIRRYAGDDADGLFYCRRYVYARLQLDERAGKEEIKKLLFGTTHVCSHCGRSFVSKKNIHLHRVDSGKGYTRENCMLLHPECHAEITLVSTRKMTQGPAKLLRKESQPYEGAFVYWWDVTPTLASRLDSYSEVEFVKRDNGQSCRIPIAALKGFLTEERQTSRGKGNWGIRILKEKPDSLAFEPGSAGDWLFLPVIWKESKL